MPKTGQSTPLNESERKRLYLLRGRFPESARVNMKGGSLSARRHFAKNPNDFSIRLQRVGINQVGRGEPPTGYK